MILINLVPEEYMERKITIPIPLREIAVLLFAVLFVFWILLMLRLGHVKSKYRALETEQKALVKDVADADKLIQEMNQVIVPKKTFLEKLEMPEAQWDQILNLISDSLPDGLWLTALNLNDQQGLLIRADGLVKPQKRRSPISSIGDFISETKKKLEFLLGQGNSSAPTLKTDTFTQQKDFDTAKLTQFVVEFRKKTEETPQ